MGVSWTDTPAAPGEEAQPAAPSLLITGRASGEERARGVSECDSKRTEVAGVTEGAGRSPLRTEGEKPGSGTTLVQLSRGSRPEPARPRGYCDQLTRVSFLPGLPSPEWPVPVSLGVTVVAWGPAADMPPAPRKEQRADLGVLTVKVKASTHQQTLFLLQAPSLRLWSCPFVI